MDILSFAKSNIVFWLWMIMYIGSIKNKARWNVCKGW